MKKEFFADMSPEDKRAFIMNAFRFISLFMLVLGYILIMYFVFWGE
jgi:hypothetical protein